MQVSLSVFQEIQRAKKTLVPIEHTGPASFRDVSHRVDISYYDWLDWGWNKDSSNVSQTASCMYLVSPYRDPQKTLDTLERAYKTSDELSSKSSW